MCDVEALSSRCRTFRHSPMVTWFLGTTGRPRWACKKNAPAGIVCRGVHDLVRQGSILEPVGTGGFAALLLHNYGECVSLCSCSQPAKNVSAAITSAATSPKG